MKPKMIGRTQSTNEQLDPFRVNRIIILINLLSLHYCVYGVAGHSSVGQFSPSSFMWVLVLNSDHQAQIQVFHSLTHLAGLGHDYNLYCGHQYYNIPTIECSLTIVPSFLYFSSLPISWNQVP